MDKLTQKIAGSGYFSNDSLQAFLQHWQQWKLPKDYMLLKEGIVSDYIYFVSSGLASIYYFKHGKEITEWMAMDETFFLSITSFFTRTPSKLNIHTFEPSVIMGIHPDDIMRLCDVYHDVERWLRKLLTRSLISSQQRVDAIQFETALHRYRRLADEYPSILQSVPLSYIAFFLGITLETLSRIREHR
jgi:CRP-like cAMP-binding protein